MQGRTSICECLCFQTPCLPACNPGLQERKMQRQKRQQRKQQSGPGWSRDTTESCQGLDGFARSYATSNGQLVLCSTGCLCLILQRAQCASWLCARKPGREAAHQKQVTHWYPKLCLLRLVTQSHRHTCVCQQVCHLDLSCFSQGGPFSCRLWHHTRTKWLQQL